MNYLDDFDKLVRISANLFKYTQQRLLDFAQKNDLMS